MGHGGSGSEAHRFILLDQFRSSQSDAALLGGAVLLTVLEQRIVSEGFIEQWLDQCHASVCPANQSFGLEFCEIAANARSRRT